MSEVRTSDNNAQVLIDGINFCKKDMISSLKIGVSGGALTGVGLVAEIYSLQDRSLTIAALGAGMMLLGGVMVKIADNDIRVAQGWLMDDAAKLANLHTEHSAPNP